MYIEKATNVLRACYVRRLAEKRGREARAPPVGRAYCSRHPAARSYLFARPRQRPAVRTRRSHAIYNYIYRSPHRTVAIYVARTNVTFVSHLKAFNFFIHKN